MIALLMLYFLLLFSYLIVSVCWFSRLLNNAFMYHHDTFCEKIYRHMIVLPVGAEEFIFK